MSYFRCSGQMHQTWTKFKHKQVDMYSSICSEMCLCVCSSICTSCLVLLLSLFTLGQLCLPSTRWREAHWWFVWGQTGPSKPVAPGRMVPWTLKRTLCEALLINIMVYWRAEVCVASFPCQSKGTICWFNSDTLTCLPGNRGRLQLKFQLHFMLTDRAEFLCSLCSL